MPRKPGLGDDAFPDLAALDLLPPRGRGTKAREAERAEPPAVDEEAPKRAPRRTAAKRSPRPTRRKPTPAAGPVVTSTSETARLTVDLAADLLETAKAAVYWTPGLTLRGLVERALADDLARRVEERGEDFPRRTGELLTGRPLAEPP